MSDLSNRIMDKLGHRVAADIGYRADIYLADFQKVSPTTAKMCLEYQPHLGIPKGDDLRQYIIKNFDGKIQPNMATARIHKNEGAVTLMGDLFVPTQSIEAGENMVAIANTRFIDKDMQETWEVQSDQEGNKFLARVSDEDIGQIINERKSRMTVKSSRVVMAQLGSGSVANVESGALIKFYMENKILEGEVTQVQEVGIKVKSGKGSFTIPREAVLEVTRLSPKTEQERKKEMMDYYTKVYGPDYAKKLTK